MKHHLANILLLAMLSFAAYANAFGNRFVWDDELFIVNNKEIRNLSGFPRFFTRGSENLYRPLRTTLYAATYRLSGLNPAGYHLAGKTLNAATVCILYVLLMALSGSPGGALWGAIIFCLHPAHTEKVAFITSSYDILGDFLWLSAFTCYVFFRKTGARGLFVASLPLFGLSLLAAENAAAMPLAVVLFDLTLGRDGRKAARWIPYFVLLAAYLTLRTSVLGTVSRVGGAVFNPDPIGNFFTISGVIIDYFRLLAVPWPLSAVHEVKQASAPYPPVLIASAIGVLATVTAAIVSAKKFPAVAFGLLWFFVVISPNLNFIPTGTLMAERYLYLPSAMLSFLVVALHTRVAEGSEGETRVFGLSPSAALKILFVVAAAVFLALTVARNRDWRTDTVLWGRTLIQNPNSYTANLDLGVEMENIGRFDDAERLFLSAVRLAPEKGDAQYELANMYLNYGRLDKAKSLFDGLSENPRLKYKALLNLSVIFAKKGDYRMADEILSGLLEKFPESVEALHNHAYVLFTQKKAGWHLPLMKIYRLTGEAAPLRDMAEGFFKLGDFRTAERVAAIGLSLSPGNAEIKELMGSAGKQPRKKPNGP